MLFAIKMAAEELSTRPLRPSAVVGPTSMVAAAMSIKVL
jgi:hypothetical protein